MGKSLFLKLCTLLTFVLQNVNLFYIKITHLCLKVTTHFDLVFSFCFLWQNLSITLFTVKTNRVPKESACIPLNTNRYIYIPNILQVWEGKTVKMTYLLEEVTGTNLQPKCMFVFQPGRAEQMSKSSDHYTAGVHPF